MESACIKSKSFSFLPGFLCLTSFLLGGHVSFILVPLKKDLGYFGV